MAARSPAVFCAHAGSAASAALMAERVSAAPRKGVWPTTSPVAGLVTSSGGAEPRTHAPPTRHASF
eukprot:CAMPEP_0170146380 /NCGR_PEP_ID=MMETSP0033_2-20121228/29908_1 /TAXON_ID=195969 /ORGANISM="Dolichomastix tenuilepis, Strain CCMP3274" /LENGTH=65 /DNA_ID=CAMNT_0010383101 /DNA_START=57 /DNA_END=251 /DNA_ORIENTATION=-